MISSVKRYIALGLVIAWPSKPLTVGSDFCVIPINKFATIVLSSGYFLSLVENTTGMLCSLLSRITVAAMAHPSVEN